LIALLLKISAEWKQERKLEENSLERREFSGEKRIFSKTFLLEEC